MTIRVAAIHHFTSRDLEIEHRHDVVHRRAAAFTPALFFHLDAIDLAVGHGFAVALDQLAQDHRAVFDRRDFPTLDATGADAAERVDVEFGAPLLV
jgi:hypothetical protein